MLADPPCLVCELHNGQSKKLKRLLLPCGAVISNSNSGLGNPYSYAENESSVKRLKSPSQSPPYSYPLNSSYQPKFSHFLPQKVKILQTESRISQSSNPSRSANPVPLPVDFLGGPLAGPRFVPFRYRSASRSPYPKILDPILQPVRNRSALILTFRGFLAGPHPVRSFFT